MHVTRERRTATRIGTRLGRMTSRRRVRLVAAGAATIALAGGGVAYASTAVFGQNQVGVEYADGLQVSSNQLIKPIGERLMTPFGKIMGSSVSPDGRFL